MRKNIEVIGQNDSNDVVIPIPHAYFKTFLAENVKGQLKLWSFILPNEDSKKPLADYLCPAIEIEIRAELSLWYRVRTDSHR